MPYVAAKVNVVKAVKAVMRQHGRPDAVINNVDIASPHLSTTAQSLDGFERVLRIHLSGTLPDVADPFAVPPGQYAPRTNPKSEMTDLILRLMIEKFTNLFAR